MKRLFYSVVVASSYMLISCSNSSGGDKKTSDSAYSGLEGTRDDASQLSNATIDTSSGQTVKKKSVDSSSMKKDSLPVK